jgi:hypothetical protein
MHSNRISIFIGLIIFAINVCLFAIYYQKQAKYTFEFIKAILGK